MAMTSWGGSPPDWKRMHPREDDQQMVLAQVVAGDMLGYVRPWPTFEPRVRMDIQTAVRMVFANPYAWGCPLDLLCDSEPVGPLPAHDWPAMPAESVIEQALLYRGKLVNRLRMARQEAILFPTSSRRRESDREILRREVREHRILRVLAWVAIACVAGALICLALLVRRFAE